MWIIVVLTRRGVVGRGHCQCQLKGEEEEQGRRAMRGREVIIWVTMTEVVRVDQEQ